jgi:hypothetical protein
LKLSSQQLYKNFATQVGNWNWFTQVQQKNQQWMDLVNSATTKEQLDESITVIWSKLGEISKKGFPHFYQKLNTLHGGSQN